MATPPEGKVSLFLQVGSTGPLRRLKLLANEIEAEYGMELEKVFRTLKDDKDRNALHMAAGGGSNEICDYLINVMKLHVDMIDRNGYSSLHHAVLAGNFPTAQYLVGIGANPSIQDLKGYTPLHFASEKGCTSIMELLISNGSPVDMLSESGTALQLAARKGHPEAVKVLLGHKPHLNVITYHNQRPIILAIWARSSECVRLLLEAGADPNIGTCGTIPLGLAVQACDTKLVEYLLEYGADPNAVNVFGMTPLEEAADDQELMQILFPLTDRIPAYTDWSISGIITQVDSRDVEAQRQIMKKVRFEEIKSKGKAAFGRKDYLSAILWYTKAFNLDPLNITLFSNRSLCWLRLNEGYRALIDAKSCIFYDPKWAKGHCRVGSAWKLLNNYAMAAEAFARALHLDPGNKEIEKELRMVQCSRPENENQNQNEGKEWILGSNYGYL